MCVYSILTVNNSTYVVDCILGARSLVDKVTAVQEMLHLCTISAKPAASYPGSFLQKREPGNTQGLEPFASDHVIYSDPAPLFCEGKFSNRRQRKATQTVSRIRYTRLITQLQHRLYKAGKLAIHYCV